MEIFFFAVSDSFMRFLTFSLIIGSVIWFGYLLYNTENRTDDSAEEIGEDKKNDENQQTSASPIAKSRPATLFIPFVRGVSASMSDQFVDHGGRTGSSSTAGIANDLTATVIKYEAEDYEFQKIETVHVDVSPGCIGMLMGKGKEYHPYDYLVFSKKPQETYNHPV